MDKILAKADRGKLSIDPLTDMPRVGGFVTSGKGMSAAKREALQLKRIAKAAAIRAKQEKYEDFSRYVDQFGEDVSRGAHTSRDMMRALNGMEIPTVYKKLSKEKSLQKAERSRKKRALKERIANLEERLSEGSAQVSLSPAPVSAVANSYTRRPIRQMTGQGEYIDAVPSGGILPAVLMNPAVMGMVSQAVTGLAKPIFKWLGKKLGLGKKGKGFTMKPNTKVKAKTDLDLWRQAFKHAKSAFKPIRNSLSGSGLTDEQFDAKLEKHIKQLKNLILGELRGSKGRRLSGSGIISVADILRPIALHSVVKGRGCDDISEKIIRRIVDKLEDEPEMCKSASELLDGGSLKTFFKKARKIIKRVGDSKVGKLLKENVLPMVTDMAKEALDSYASGDNGTKGSLAGIASDILGQVTAGEKA